MTERTKTHLKLIGLRLWLIPYFFIAMVITMILVIFTFFTTIVLGGPLWIINGNPFSWMDWFPDNLDIPTLFGWDDFREDVADKQRKFDKGENIFGD